MFWLLLALFVVVPTLELALLIQIGRAVGAVPTVLLVLVTGALGAWLARRQGFGVLRQVQTELQAGRVPAGALVDGVIILLAAAVLLTPGLLTDAVGFLCLVPAVRRAFKARLWRWLQDHSRRGDVQITVDISDYRSADDPVDEDSRGRPPRALPPD